MNKHDRIMFILCPISVLAEIFERGNPMEHSYIAAVAFLHSVRRGGDLARTMTNSMRKYVKAAVGITGQYRADMDYCGIKGGYK